MTISKKILVVDDNIEHCESVMDVLEMEGYDVAGVYDGYKAVEAIGKDRFDLVLMDIKMPGIDGIDTFKKIKEYSPRTPAIVMTAFFVEKHIIEGLRAGVFGYFQKPINYERLFCSIECAFPDSALVMIAENNKEFYSGLHDVLVEEGYRVVTARDREIAVQQVKEKRFDIIIMDNQSPDINSNKVYLAIRAFRPDVPIISIKGNKEDAANIVDQLPEKNVYAYIEKPLNIEHLLEVVRNVLENR